MGIPWYDEVGFDVFVEGRFDVLAVSRCEDKCIGEIEGRCDDTFIGGAEIVTGTGGGGVTGFALASAFSTVSMTEDNSSH